VTVLVVALTGFGFLGGVWWVFDLAAPFRVQYSLTLLLLAVVLAVARWRSMALVAAAGCVVNLVFIVPLFIGSPAVPAGSERFEILSFNVKETNTDQPRIVDYVASSGADLVFLYEATPELEHAVAESDLPYRMVTTRTAGWESGTLALVPEGTEVHVLPFGSPERGSIEVIARFGGRDLDVLGTHTPSPVSSSEAAARDTQLAAIGEWAAQRELPAVVVGDFNASTWSHGFSLVSRAGLINSQRGYGIQASWPADHPLLATPIDHLLYSSELTVVDRRLGERLGSDHRSLFVTLAWSARE
jgi:endonuclease/exonuclease/phosphatase (EEP) superfamily protein YafD